MNKSVVIYLIGLLLFFSSISYSQTIENEKNSIGYEKSNEIKVNLFYSFFGVPEINYERILRNNFGTGVSLQLLFGKEISRATDLLFVPYLRRYFSKGNGVGFFGEIHVRGFNTKDIVTDEKKTGLSIGPSIGYKFQKKSWIGELYFGAGKVIVNENAFGATYFDRYGISIGRRF